MLLLISPEIRHAHTPTSNGSEQFNEKRFLIRATYNEALVLVDAAPHPAIHQHV